MRKDVDANVPFRITGRALLLNDQNKILLVRHDHTYWYTPGGRLEHNESLLECAQREIYEETGLQIQLDKLVLVDEYFSEDNKGHNIAFYFFGRCGDVVISEEWQDKGGPVVEAKFFSHQEIQHLPVVHPEFLKNEFWLLLKSDFTNCQIYCDSFNTTLLE